MRQFRLGIIQCWAASRGSPPWFKGFFTDFFFEGGYCHEKV